MPKQHFTFHISVQTAVEGSEPLCTLFAKGITDPNRTMVSQTLPYLLTAAILEKSFRHALPVALHLAWTTGNDGLSRVVFEEQELREMGLS